MHNFILSYKFKYSFIHAAQLLLDEYYKDDLISYLYECLV